MFFLSCEKTIEITLPDAKEKLVVEGVISQGIPPFVILSQSQKYFDPINVDVLSSIVVKDADVEIEYNGVVTKLDLVCASDVDPSFIIIIAQILGVDPVVLQTVDYCFYSSLTLVGQINTSYNLKINWKGDTYTSTTTIPSPIPLDSVWFEPFGEFENLGRAWARINDPGDENNYYRWQAQRISTYSDGELKDPFYITPSFAIFDDSFFNGLSFDAVFFRGTQTGSVKEDDKGDEAGLFSINDTIAIRFISLDYASYKFYETVELNQNSAGNPFSSPASVVSNINGGALGVWSGYGAYYDTIYPGNF